MRWQLWSRRQENLPEMRWPMILVNILAVCLFIGLGVSRQGADVLLALPFLSFAVMLYTVLLVLWRKIASLAVVPAAIFAGLLFGSSLPISVMGTVGVFAVSYGSAWLLLERKARFVRITASAIWIGGLLFAALLYWVYSRFGSETEALQYCQDSVMHAVQTAQERLQDVYGDVVRDSAVMQPDAAAEMVNQIALTLPALIGWFATVLAAFCSAGIHWLLRLLGCENFLVPNGDREITTPRSFAGVFCVLLFLVMATSSTANPLLYSILANCYFVFALPCAYVGITAGLRAIRNRLAELFLLSHPLRGIPLPTVIAVCVLLLLGGGSTAFTVMAIYGAWCILNPRQKKSDV